MVMPGERPRGGEHLTCVLSSLEQLALPSLTRFTPHQAGTIEEQVRDFVKRQTEQDDADPEEHLESTAMEANPGGWRCGCWVAVQGAV